MERRRPRLDPMVAAQINDRLALVLAERSPRRAQLEEDQPDSPPDSGPVTVTGPRSAAPRGHPAREDQTGGDQARAAGATASNHDTATELHDLDELPPVRRFSRLHLAVLGGLVVVGLLFAGWSLFRARPVAIASPGSVAPSSSTSAGSGPATTAKASSSSSSPPAKATIVVHILGAVRRPGLVTLPERARVQDAIDAAGGLKSGARPGDLNLAQQLSDGQQVVISRGADPPSEVRDGGAGGGAQSGGGQGGGGQGGGGRSGGGGSTILDLNRATPAQLEALPGVGPVTAGKIMAWREEHGRFSRVEELQEIDGIGPKIYAQIAPHLRV